MWSNADHMNISPQNGCSSAKDWLMSLSLCNNCIDCLQAQQHLAGEQGNKSNLFESSDFISLQVCKPGAISRINLFFVDSVAYISTVAM